MNFSDHSVACDIKMCTYKYRRFITESLRLCEYSWPRQRWPKVSFKDSGERPHDVFILVKLCQRVIE